MEDVSKYAKVTKVTGSIQAPLPLPGSIEQDSHWEKDGDGWRRLDVDQDIRIVEGEPNLAGGKLAKVYCGGELRSVFLDEFFARLLVENSLAARD